MTKPKGGRGLRAECPTTVIRVPVGLVHTIEAITLHYRITQTDIVALALSELHKRAKSAQPTRNWTEMVRYIDEVAAACPADWLEQYAEATQEYPRQ